MRQSVRDMFVPMSSSWEGVVPWLYQDVKGLVTIAIGVLVDDGVPGRVNAPEQALALPLVHKDGRRATRLEIAAEWRAVKTHPTAARQGHRVLERVTKLRLTPEGVARVTLDKLATMESELHARFPAFETWCADAQLATLSMAWACGPWFAFPKMVAALRRMDFRTAGAECTISERGNPGVAPRNVANRIMLANAAMVHAPCFDDEETRATLFWPHHITSGDDLRARMRRIVTDDATTAEAIDAPETERPA